MDPGKFLIVDDETNIRTGLKAILTRDGHQVMDVGSAEEALPVLETFPCEVTIVDIRMPGMSGLDLLNKIRTRWPAVAIILLTGHGTLETAMRAVKEGAHDYRIKPAQPEAIRQAVAVKKPSSSNRYAPAWSGWNNYRPSPVRPPEALAVARPAPSPPATCTSIWPPTKCAAGTRSFP